MLRKIEGEVASYKAVNVRDVELQIRGHQSVIRLNLDSPWMLRDGDHIVISGEDDGRSGRFHGYAYRNESRAVCGMSEHGWEDAVKNILVGLVFSWAIFPLFTHLPDGLRRLYQGIKVDRAAEMVGCPTS